MKQLGNLAVICARRRGVLLQILDGKATLFVGEGTARRSFTADWDDDEHINRLIHELNFGEVSGKEATL
jgi:hypothetical protein